MPTYRIERRNDYLDIFEKCKRQNVGFVAMKTGISPNDPERTASILKDKQITTICRTIRTLEEVKKYISASNKHLTEADINKTVRLARASSFGRCMMCGTCTLNCPEEIAVSDIVRCVDYYVDTMRDMNIANENYADIETEKRADMCKNCGLCESKCPNNVPIRHYIARARRIFA